ncbi:Ger(x)C family spore germination protein [Paenibacillus anseongense]|uniref:Ger(x)C family spore germination protein n=1 Tax=Paenibacillus anseongense TaxID=2682845 RepID=UPI002DB7464E|nr:Ger(x)C family spore germination protein [Paenibacillus anseongense]MEC0268424.1 Ger(x)C family spore germination protein [Paenibacillus anseongense]
MKKWLFILLLLCLCGGCGFKDIDKRFFVVSIGIDKSEHKNMKYRISLKLAVPGSSLDNSSAQYELITQDANSITEAVRLLKSKVDKELDFGHAKIIIFGYPFLKENGINELDWLNRRRDIQLVSWVAVGQPSAEAVLGTKISHERMPGNSLLLSFGKTGVESGYVVSEYLFNFYRKKKELGLDPILSIVESANNHFTINTAVLFDKENVKLTLNSNETRLFNIMKASINKVEIEAPFQDSKFFVSVDHINSNYHIRIPKSGPPYVDMHIKMRGVIEESASGPLEINQLSQYEAAVCQSSEEKILRLLKKFRDNKLDPLGFGLKYRSRHFGKVEEEWRTWQALYPELEFRVGVEMKLEGVGVIK